MILTPINNKDKEVEGYVDSITEANGGKEDDLTWKVMHKAR